ncbi:hypothetical protein G6F45_012111 [Rhizopus arrhizus]|uniref:Uncharacterized protein n=1 Tax=Rhizopus oryzae TaxID=64495 RepID=A0A9P6XXA2_RHIOR|nr:hypothetical protein G6F54_012053 [Rhizopus delemar]KAG1534186.1 hypothetical protein G6F51_012240 [Rhizopus arrhizus]KAG1496916.1 hypothetical protein G6F53_012077 [Rhizopus delemar]KAG1510310.1 hypothetical protein G6F52_010933 [Rhizopus delemar]KAG1616897.1 hypothetical protein G6F44_013096 [Rhizopus delemar]
MKTYDQKLIHKCKHLICINIEKFKRIEISTKSKRSSKVGQKDRALRIYLGSIGSQGYDYDLHTALIGSPLDVDQR